MAEGTGIYFALAGAEQFSRENPDPEIQRLVNGESLFVNRQHAGQSSPVDQAVAIAPVADTRGPDGNQGGKHDGKR